MAVLHVVVYKGTGNPASMIQGRRQVDTGFRIDSCQMLSRPVKAGT